MYNIVFMKSEMRFAIILVLLQLLSCEAILDKEPIAISIATDTLLNLNGEFLYFSITLITTFYGHLLK